MTEPETPAPRFWGRKLLGGLVLAGVGAVLVVHLLVRDAWPQPWCTLFYATPRPLLLLATSGVWLLVRKPVPRLGAVAAGLSLLLLGWVLGADCAWNSSSGAVPEGSVWKIVTWNAAHLPRGREVAAETILGWNADLIGVVEAGPIHEATLGEWRELLPGYELTSPAPGMLWIAKGTLESTAGQRLSPRSEVGAVTATRDGESLPSVLVSLTSDPRRQRQQPFQQLQDFLTTLSEEPVLILGDFNTPADSVWWTELRRTHRNAFAEAGHGHRATWPTVFPVLELDYLWVSSRVRVIRCWQGWTWASDHQPVVAEIVVEASE